MEASGEVTAEIVEVRRLRLGLSPPIVTAHGVWSHREGFLFGVAVGDGSQIVGVGEAGCVPGFGSQEPVDLLDPGPARSFAFWAAVQAPVALPSRVGTAILGLERTIPPGGRRKLKIAVGPIGAELAQVREQMETLPEAARIRLDANGGLDLDAFRQWMPLLEDDRIEYLEQPFPPGSKAYGLDLVRRIENKLALDESVTTYDDWRQVVDRGWVGWGILKPSLAGIPDPEILADPRIVISSAFESPVGWLAVAALAVRYGRNLPGLDTLNRFPGCEQFAGHEGWIHTGGIAEAATQVWEQAARIE